MKTDIPHLLLAVDLGGSGTKIVGGIKGNEGIKVSLMPPHCVEVKDPNELVVNLDYDEYNTWIAFEGQSYAVGNLAAIKYNAINKLRPAKFTSAVPKICAAIAVFAQRFNLSSKFNVSLTFVLPPAEWEQKQIVIDRLQSALTDLQTPRGKIKARLLLTAAQPEGMGILLGQDIDLKSVDNPVTVIMLGYRNASVLSSNKGVIARPTTSNLGFSDLLQSIASKTGYKIDDIIVPVFSYNKYQKDIVSFGDTLTYATMRLEKYDCLSRTTDREIVSICDRQISDAKKQLSSALNPLLRCSGLDRQAELDHLIKSIDTANKDYWIKLTDWLDETMPNQSSYICLSGGTANYFRDELELYAKTKMIYHEDRLRWHTKVDAAKILNVSDDRFDDIYVLWTVFCKKN